MKIESSGGRSMRNMPADTLQEHIADNEIKVECPKCGVTMIVKVADLRSKKLLRCPACRTPIEQEELF